MRTIISIFAVLYLVGALQLASVTSLLGQEPVSADARGEAYREWQTIANGRTDFEVSDPAFVPTQLALAATQSGCRYKEAIKDVPLRFLSIEKRRLALVFCLGVVGSHQVFDLSDLTKPTLMEFPYLAQPKGFGMTVRPGALAWKPGSGLLEAVAGSDLCGSPGVRHTYQLAGSGFVVIRVDVKADSCTQSPWTTIWDAPQWSLSAGQSAH